MNGVKLTAAQRERLIEASRTDCHQCHRSRSLGIACQCGRPIASNWQLKQFAKTDAGRAALKEGGGE